MQKQTQVIVKPETNSAYCPYCGISNLIEYKKPFWVLSKGCCEHASMAVAAGMMEIAIHFVVRG